jgi:hypothetical protein
MSLGYPEVSRVTASVAAETSNTIAVTLQAYSAAQDRLPTSKVALRLVTKVTSSGALEVCTSALTATTGLLLPIDTGVTHAIVETDATGAAVVVVTDTGSTAITLEVWDGARLMVSANCPFA